MNRCVRSIAAGVVLSLTASCERESKRISLGDKLEFGLSESQIVVIVGEPLYLDATMLVGASTEEQLQYRNGIYYLAKPIYLNEGDRQVSYRLGFDRVKELIEIRLTENRLGTTSLDEIAYIERVYKEGYERRMTSRN